MPNFIVIEGNIGSGKTSLSKRIAEEYMSRLILERFTDNPFLPRFYKDQKRYAFPVELSFLADRYTQLKTQITSPGLFSNYVVADYYFMKSLIFAMVTLDDDEFKLFRQLFDIMSHSLPKPDLYVYLHPPVERLLKNIKKRGRDYEKHITAEYLAKVDNSYADFFKQAQLPILILDIHPDIDFVHNKEHYEMMKSVIFGEKFEIGVNRSEILP